MTEPPTPVTVSAYAGASYPQRPIAVHWQGQRLEALQIERTWRTPDALHFRLQIETLGRVELSYHPRTDTWTLISLAPPRKDPA
ncbi:MAG: hypothetical protein GXP37_10260 [Chloroflexi bacterium]|nr:hypothetical protein [Chloroflexota bacterium]